MDENTLAVGKVSAEDPDGDQLTYSVLGTDGASFDIEMQTGSLRFSTAPDFENPGDADANNTYDVIVRASDDLQSSDIAFSVTVANAEEINIGPYLPLSVAERDYQNFEAVNPLTIEIEELFVTPDRLWSLKIFEPRLAIASSVNGFFYVHNLHTSVTTELDLNGFLPLYNEGQGGIFDFELVQKTGHNTRVYFCQYY